MCNTSTQILMHFYENFGLLVFTSISYLQVNFFDDHTKIIMSYMKNDYYVTYIDQERTANTYCMMQIIQDGCRKDIVQRMNFAKKMLKNLVDIEGVDI